MQNYILQDCSRAPERPGIVAPSLRKKQVSEQLSGCWVLPQDPPRPFRGTVRGMSLPAPPWCVCLSSCVWEVLALGSQEALGGWHRR